MNTYIFIFTEEDDTEIWVSSAYGETSEEAYNNFLIEEWKENQEDYGLHDDIKDLEDFIKKDPFYLKETVMIPGIHKPEIQ
jgi:hypothetical protein